MKTIHSDTLPEGFREILRTTVGSEVHGTGVGGDDHDEMGICIPTMDRVLGLGQEFEQLTWRTQPEGARSGPGDIDRTIYGLRKYCKLAASCNPTVLLPLFAPPEFVIFQDGFGDHLIRNRDMFFSQQARATFGGYMRQQAERLGAGKSRGKPRPELVEKYGFDTKYAGHIIRLGLQGVEFLTTGNLTLPMEQEHRETIVAIRNGEWTVDQVLLYAGLLENDIDNIPSILPGRVDAQRINEFIVTMHREHWADAVHTS